MDTSFTVDFAISYAGEDVSVARELAAVLREYGFTVFLADAERHLIVGLDGEVFFERLFAEAKEVIALISSHYRDKEWTRYEWDVIRDREPDRRFIPIRLDDTRILGLPSSILYLEWSGDNVAEIVKVCVKRLLMFERKAGIERPTRYERILDAITNDSAGALAEAFQLVVDRRERTPLADATMAPDESEPCYRIAEEKWHNYSAVRRRSLKVLLPTGLSRDEVRFNLKHCCIAEFNAHKPDAVCVWGYRSDMSDDLNRPFDIGMVEFAPFGKWSKAADGLAYNIPTEEFDFSVTLVDSYFAGG